MVLECQLTDELAEVSNDPEEEVNPFGSAVHRIGLSPKSRANPRELDGNNYNSQKNQQFDFLLQVIDERMDSHF